MKRNILKRTAGFLIASIILISSAITSLAGEQLGATDFDDGVGLPWHIVESATGKMDFRIENGVYEITIINPGGASNGGEDRWDCQFRHRGLKIVSGHQYHVQYEITASNSGKFYTKIGTLDGKTEVWHNMSDGYNLDMGSDQHTGKPDDEGRPYIHCEPVHRRCGMGLPSGRRRAVH